MTPRTSSGHSDDYHLGAYAGTQQGPLGLRLGVSHTWHDIKTVRSVSFQDFSDSPSADYSGGTNQIFGDLGFRLAAGPVALEPYVNLAYVKLHTDGFTESAGAAALNGRGTTNNDVFGTPGVRGASTFDVRGLNVMLRCAIGWRHLFETPASTTQMRFSAASNPFNIAGVPIAADAATVEGGVDVRVTSNAVFSVSYGGQFGNSAREQSVRGVLNASF